MGYRCKPKSVATRRRFRQTDATEPRRKLDAPMHLALQDDELLLSAAFLRFGLALDLKRGYEVW